MGALCRAAAASAAVLAFTLTALPGRRDHVGGLAAANHVSFDVSNPTTPTLYAVAAPRPNPLPTTPAEPLGAPGVSTPLPPYGDPRPRPSPTPAQRRAAVAAAAATPAPAEVRFFPFLRSYLLAHTGLPAANCGGGTFRLTLGAVDVAPGGGGRGVGAALRIPHSSIRMDGYPCGAAAFGTASRAAAAGGGNASARAVGAGVRVADGEGGDADDGDGYLTVLPDSALGYADRAAALGVTAVRVALRSHKAAASMFDLLFASTDEFYVGYEGGAPRDCGAGGGAPAGTLFIWHATRSGTVRYDRLLENGLQAAVPPGVAAVAAFVPPSAGAVGNGVCLWVDASSPQMLWGGDRTRNETGVVTACFPEGGAVALANGSVGAMGALAVGDVVCTPGGGGGPGGGPPPAAPPPPPAGGGAPPPPHGGGAAGGGRGRGRGGWPRGGGGGRRGGSPTDGARRRPLRGRRPPLPGARV